ncbi:DUF4848 domain-containing protein [uncultured Aquimarina sp.]|uniref:DUF4848 domain-containing protein n=1 Tax=uncultured Aquimarina sp. TaxID=575652 RepID=UPI002622BA45|nr:DUF4848 domain-containing protein [uncultured Aquimarina sp.]
MKNILKITLSIFSFLLIYSCQQELEVNDELENINQEINIEEITSKIYVSEDGVLNFATTEDFKNTILWIKDLSEEEIISWNNDIGFNSLFSVYTNALDEEKRIYNQYKDFLQEDNSKDIALAKSFDEEYNSLKKKYENYMSFDGYTIDQFKIKDEILATLLDKNGIVYVAGSKLQYSNKELKINLNYKNDPSLKKSGNKDDDLIVINLLNENINKTFDVTLKDNCIWSPPGERRELTGNTSIINTFTPQYRQVWVPRECNIVCSGLEELPIDPSDGGIIPIGDPGECYEVCTGGYYRNVFVRNNLTSTRLVATMRSYKCRQAFVGLGCSRRWSIQSVFLVINTQGFIEEINPGSFSKFTHTEDLSNRGITNIEVTYSRRPSDSNCTTQISW